MADALLGPDETEDELLEGDEEEEESDSGEHHADDDRQPVGSDGRRIGYPRRAIVRTRIAHGARAIDAALRDKKGGLDSSARPRERSEARRALEKEWIIREDGAKRPVWRVAWSPD
jgi:hypothetical protein